MELKDKTILLTGATGGIGQVTAQALAEKGAHLILVARSEARLIQLKEALPNPAKHRIYVVDLSRDEELQILSDSIQLLGHKIDVVINNAGVNQFDFLANRSAASIRQELIVNLQTPILLAKLALNWLNQPGIILNIGSTFGGIGFPGYSVYGATKSGLYRFSEALARELKGTNIQVLFLAPRATDTDLNSIVVRDLNQALGSKSDSPEFVARSIVRSLENEQVCRWLGWPEKLFVLMNQIVPSLVSHAIGKKQDIIIHHSKIQQHTDS